MSKPMIHAKDTVKFLMANWGGDYRTTLPKKGQPPIRVPGGKDANGLPHVAVISWLKPNLYTITLEPTNA